MIFINQGDDRKFDFNDFSIIPHPQTTINSRKDIYTKVTDEKFNNTHPIIVAPMDTILDVNSTINFVTNSCMVCFPRQPEYHIFKKNKSYPFTKTVFTSISLNEFELIVNDKIIKQREFRLLVDIANGHLKKLTDLIVRFKKLYPLSTLMVGNIAHPLTFNILSNAGADYIRVGIGSGAACTTSANSAVHYPSASLIYDCAKEKKDSNLKAKLVADGGFKNFDDIIKAIALGADYVMLGNIFNKTIEACGQAYLFNIPISNRKVKYIFEKIPMLKPHLKRKYRGMSTKEVQKTWNKSSLTTSEGIVKYNNIEYTTSQWLENFEHYLKSAMSYSNCNTIYEFQRESLGAFITNSSFLRFKK